MMQVVFWENTLSPHKAPWVRALAEMQDLHVTVIAEREALAWREALGWSLPEFGRCRIIVCRDTNAVGRLIDEAGDVAVHVTCGVVRGCELAACALKELTRRRARVGVISEAPDRAGWRGAVRRVVYQKDRARFAGSIDFLLAMGSQGVDWFSECGYPPHKVFPFAYAAERLPDPPPVVHRNHPAKLIYVGELAAWKGPEILLEALEGLRGLDWTLTIVGAGPLEKKCRRMVSERGLSEQVRFVGVLKNQDARLEMQGSDLLLLPSKHDGWGTVINEALMAGVQAICSNHCGARDLLSEPWRGEVVAAGSAANLREALSRRIRVSRTSELARRIRGWSKLIEGESLASYFLSVLNCVYGNEVRPTPPWMRTSPDLVSGV